MVDETYNPWAVTCIDSFNFLCCPECVYRSKEESSFQSHAIQNHPKSEAFFKPESTIEPEVEVHVFYCCPECDYKSKDVNVFQIHALEKHPTSLSFFTREETNDSSNLGEKADTNPWEVENLEAFCFFCCSECNFKSNEDKTYQSHMLENHPQLTSNGFEVKEEQNDNNQYSMELPMEVKLEPFEDEIDAKIEPEEFSGDFGPLPSDTEDVVLKKVKKDRKDKENKVKKKNYDKNRKKKEKCEQKNGLICSYCSEEFSNVNDLRSHRAKVHVNLQCNVCDKIFGNIPKLAKHQRTHKRKKKKCQICGKLISGSMKRHVLSIHGDKSIKPFKCDQENCAYVTNTKSNLDLHRARCIEKGSGGRERKNYVCHICKQRFPATKRSEYEYIKHYRVSHDNIPPEFMDRKQYLCSECPEIYFNKESFKNHEWKHKEDNKNLKKYTCKKCEMTFVGKQNYVLHCEKVHDEIVSRVDFIECNSCEMKFKAPTFYIQHHQSVHGNIPPEYTDKELLVCDQCPNVFICKTSLNAHILNVHSDPERSRNNRKERQCPYCEKVFKAYNNYKEHVLVKHEKNAKFECDECHRSFGTQGKLQNHKVLVHQRVKCNECGKEICNSFILKRHRATVHGIKPDNAHQCEHCPMFFSSSLPLEKHIASKHPGIEQKIV